MPEARSETTEDDRPAGLAGRTASAPALTGALTLLFEAGRPCAVPSYALGDLDAVTLGRASDARSSRLTATGDERTLFLELPDRRMSVVHAYLRRGAAGWSIEDAGSRNGTRVNGTAVSRAALHTGDLVELGRSFLVFRDDVAPASAPADEPPPGLATANPVLARQLTNLMTIARSSISVVIYGETGTGKELVSRGIHELSGRAGPLQALNCGALPRSVLESELFGYRKGAFSGATEDRPGLVRAADKGTLFLDEIGDLPLDAQAALLRVLQEGEVLPIGGVRPVAVDVRVVAATHRDLGDMVTQGTFRADLLARLGGFSVVLPPLRARREDLGALVQRLLARLAPDRAASLELAPAAIHALHGHAWPGNIRELEKVLAAAVLLSGNGAIELEHLPEALRAPPPAPAATPGAPATEQAQLEALLVRHRGNINAVARELHTSRTQIHRLCRRMGIDVQALRVKP